MVTCHSTMVTNDINQSKICLQWAFERDLNSSGLVTQNMSEAAFHAITRIELIFRELTGVNLKLMEQLLQYGGKWIQDLCDSVILQRKAAREMFMGLRKLVGHNVKVIKDEMKMLKSVQNNIDRAHCEIMGVKQQVSSLREDVLVVLIEIEREGKGLLEKVFGAIEHKEAAERILREQEGSFARTEKALSSMQQQCAEANRKVSEKVTEMQTLQKELSGKARFAEDELRVEKENLKTTQSRHQEEIKTLNAKIETEKAKSLKAMEQVDKLNAELSLQRELVEATKNENAIAERGREDCIISLRKAEQEIEYLTKWAHEKSMELQKKDDAVARLLRENEELKRAVNSLQKERDDSVTRTCDQEGGEKLDEEREKCLEKNAGEVSSAQSAPMGSKDEKKKDDEVECPAILKQSTKKDMEVGKIQTFGAPGRDVPGNGDASAQKRTRIVHESSGPKRRRTSARTTKQTAKTSRRRGDEGPSSARTAGIQISSGSDKNQLKEKYDKDGQGAVNKLQDDDFLVCDDLYSDNVLG